MAVISGWVLIFYTQFCGLSAGQAATIFAVARVLDAFSSPMIGYISDHFGTTALGRRFGRRRWRLRCGRPGRRQPRRQRRPQPRPGQQ